MEVDQMISVKKGAQDGKKLWQYLAALSASILSLAAGSVLAWTSPTLPKLEKPDAWLHVTKEQGSWVGSLMGVGAIIGSLPAGKIADKFGRKKCILALAVFYLTSWLLIIFAKSVAMLYVARFVGGIGVGSTTVLVPMYISEISEISTRGALGTMFQLFLTLGILFSFVVGSKLPYTWFAVACALIEAMFLVTFIWMPESPLWLVGQGRKPEASKALVVLRGDDYDVGEELSDMQQAVEDAVSRKSTMADLIKTRAARVSLIAAVGALALQQLSGINAVIFYTSTIFQAAGSSLPEDTASIIVASVQVVMSAVSAFLVDRAGRKVLLIISASVMALCLFLLGLYFQLQMSNIGWLPLASLTVFMIVFSIGFGPVPWMLVGEMFPPETKGLASGMSAMTNWFVTFIVTKTFPDMTAAFGSAITFWLFSALMVGGTFFTIFVIPETKGKSVQQLQDELNGKANSSDA